MTHPELPPSTPLKQKRGPRKKIVRKNTNSPQYVREKMASPEMTKKRLEGLRKWREANPGRSGRGHGQPDGVRLKDWLKIKEQAAIKAEKAIKIMAEKKIWVPENDMSERAMRTALEVMESNTGETRNRLAAAKTILEFVQPKPVVKTETTIKSAEAFLEALAEDEGNEPQS